MKVTILLFVIINYSLPIVFSQGTYLNNANGNEQCVDVVMGINYCDECCFCCADLELDTSSTMEGTNTCDINTTTIDNSTLLCDVNATLEQFKRSFIPKTVLFLSDVIRQNNGKESAVICSPFATIYLLAAIIKFAYGRVTDQILRVFNVDTLNQIDCLIQTFDQYLKNNENKVDFAYKGVTIAANQQFPLTDAFKNYMTYPILGAGANFDFSNQAGVNNYNSLIANLSQGKVTDVFTSTEPFNSATQLVFGVGQYFASPPRIPFKTALQGPFYISASQTINRSYVSNTAVYKYKYSRIFRAKMVQLELSGNFSTLMILPDKKDGLNSLIRSLSSNYDGFHSDFISMTDTLVNVTIPTYENITTTVKTMPIIRKTLSVSALFNPRQLRLSNVIKGNINVAVTYSQQKNIFKLNYSGGSSASVSGNNNRPNATVFCQQPFLVLINLNTIPVFAIAALK